MAEDRTDFEYTALCPAGFEEPLADELRRLGCRRTRPLKGSVSFFGSLRDGYRACLWSRLASRVVLVLRRVDCETADELYDACREMRWEDVLAPGATFAVDARGRSRTLGDVRFATLRVKDAVCDCLRDVRGERPSVDAEAPDVLLYAAVHDRRTTLGVDLGAGSLIDHGYRVPARGRAPQGGASFVREDMAALVLALGGWTKVCGRTDRARLVDPLGASPALALEAACVALGRAPRLARRRWGFAGWLGHDEAVWAEELAAAQRAFDDARSRTGVRVTVACPDAGVRAEIAEGARRAGVAAALDVQPCGAGALDLGSRQLPDALVACALPDAAGAVSLRRGTGQQTARVAALAALARTEALAEAPVVALTSGESLSVALGCEPETRFAVINGKEDTQVLVYPSAAQTARKAALERAARAGSAEPDAALLPGTAEGAAGAAPEAPGVPEGAAAVAAGAGMQTLELPGGPVGLLVPSSAQFAARLAKVARHRGKWARREGVSCYRVYDADMPDYALSVDLYQGGASTPGRWLVMSEYAAPKEIDEALAARRLTDALAIAPRVMGVNPDDVFLKVRRRAKGGSQYTDQRASEGRTALVEEGGLVFEVNFSDYLDTGLFLDHRLVRSTLRTMAPKTRFLNLYAYTGTATCYAADGGAFQTTTVDLSNTYLAWARRNMEQNGFGGPAHEYVQADVMPWIAEQRRTGNRWDLIYIDPPTFSNSARMRKRGFNVQDDHTELLIGASRLLVRGGTIVFSCNLRGFKPDEEALAKAGVAVEDVTPGSIPEDFSRNAKIHHCYLVRRSD